MDARRSIFVALAILFAFSVIVASRPGASTPTERVYAMVAAALLGMPLLALLASTPNRRHVRPGSPAVPAADEGNRRETYRLAYPEGNRPKLYASSLSDHPFEVLDVSEEGLRLRAPLAISVGEMVEATLLFPSGRRASVCGGVVRREGSEVALHLVRGVPAKVLIEEQLDRRASRR